MIFQYFNVLWLPSISTVRPNRLLDLSLAVPLQIVHLLFHDRLSICSHCATGWRLCKWQLDAARDEMVNQIKSNECKKMCFQSTCKNPWKNPQLPVLNFANLPSLAPVAPSNSCTLLTFLATCAPAPKSSCPAQHFVERKLGHLTSESWVSLIQLRSFWWISLSISAPWSSLACGSQSHVNIVQCRFHHTRHGVRLKSNMKIMKQEITRCCYTWDPQVKEWL